MNGMVKFAMVLLVVALAAAMVAVSQPAGLYR